MDEEVYNKYKNAVMALDDRYDEPGANFIALNDETRELEAVIKNLPLPEKQRTELLGYLTPAKMHVEQNTFGDGVPYKIKDFVKPTEKQEITQVITAAQEINNYLGKAGVKEGTSEYDIVNLFIVGKIPDVETFKDICRQANLPADTVPKALRARAMANNTKEQENWK